LEAGISLKQSVEATFRRVNSGLPQGSLPGSGKDLRSKHSPLGSFRVTKGLSNGPSQT